MMNANVPSNAFTGTVGNIWEDILLDQVQVTNNSCLVVTSLMNLPANISKVLSEMMGIERL